MSNYLKDDIVRQAKPQDDDLLVTRIEVSFAIPTYLPIAAMRELDGLLSHVVRLKMNQPEGGVHWVSGYGSKALWSKADAILLGKTPSSDAPDKGEPQWDDTVYTIETTAREKHPGEK